jgi:hypothetical protein
MPREVIIMKDVESMNKKEVMKKHLILDLHMKETLEIVLNLSLPPCRIFSMLEEMNSCAKLPHPLQEVGDEAQMVPAGPWWVE